MCNTFLNFFSTFINLKDKTFSIINTLRFFFEEISPWRVTPMSSASSREARPRRLGFPSSCFPFKNPRGGTMAAGMESIISSQGGGFNSAGSPSLQTRTKSALSHHHDFNYFNFLIANFQKKVWRCLKSINPE